MRIYIIGYMASGKSHLGRVLAKELGYAFLDLDYLFEERYHVSILDFFEKYDEEVFRNIERSLLHETLEMDNIVISTGGGTPCFFDNMEIISRAGISIYLSMEVPALVSRLKQVKRKRPLLKDILPAELEKMVVSQMKDREDYYTRADIKINGLHPDLDNVVRMLRDRIDAANPCV